MSAEQLADSIGIVWIAASGAILGFGFANVPLLIFFFFHRRSQLRGRDFERRVTTPIHAALHYFCVFAYGLFIPLYYFLIVRGRRGLVFWDLGERANSALTVALGAITTAWLLAHVIEAALRRDRIRFGPGWVDRSFAAVGTGLWLWFVLNALGLNFTMLGNELIDGMRRTFGFDGLDGVFRRSGAGRSFVSALAHLYLQSFYLGGLAIHGFALAESFARRTADVEARRWRVAVPIGAGVIGLMFSPFLFYAAPKLSEREAIAVVQEHRDIIVDVAMETRVEPAFLAGVVYAGQRQYRSKYVSEKLDRALLYLGTAGILNEAFPMNGEFGPAF